MIGYQSSILMQVVTTIDLDYLPHELEHVQASHPLNTPSSSSWSEAIESSITQAERGVATKTGSCFSSSMLIDTNIGLFASETISVISSADATSILERCLMFAFESVPNGS